MTSSSLGKAILCFLASLVVVGLTAQAGITQGKIKTEILNSEIVLIADKGFHFNDKAPASAVFDDSKTKAQPKLKSEPKFVFDIPAGTSKGSIKFFVCDDAKTVCEQHTQDVDVKAKKNSGGAKVEVNETSIRYLAEAKASSSSNLDFKSDKSTLIVFSAPWCPACIRLKSETLNQASIKKELKKINVTYLNIDLVQHEAVSKRFNVKAIPTMILVNQQGQEVYRWLDYQKQDSFLGEIRFAKKLKTNLEETKKLAELGDQDAVRRMGENSFNQMNWLEAVKWYGLSKAPLDLQRRLYAEVSLAKDEMEKDEKNAAVYLQTLMKAIALSTSNLDALSWKIDYFETAAEKGPKDFISQNEAAIRSTILDLDNLVTNAKALKQDLAKSNMTGLYGFEPMEILDIMARGYSVLKDDKAKKETQERLYKFAAAKKVDLNYPGELIHTIYYLSQAGRTKESENLTIKLIEKYPKSYVYYDRYAKMLLKQKRFEEALKQAQIALEFKEGNEPQLNVVRTRALIGLNKKTEAISVINETMKIVEAYPDKYKRTKVTLTGLRADAEKLKD